ncbi:MAG: YkgJ family cysteine cluster protein, partial [Deltaproteobacteria bacterium]|nr:YkgJ family cysteine cluster protein [Deltaproteobacteria bacterium]MBW2531121.1 YkgJ family cysteine cluster protein [Deltaproteobacteria bacterium]
MAPRDSEPAEGPPPRPALGTHVAVRRHLIEGREQLSLHDLLHEQVAVVGPREWALLRSADGTRGIEGILAAAARRGHYARPEELERFLAELDAAGLLARPEQNGDRPVAEAPARAAARLDPLPGYRLDCDGRGSCCRIYPTIVFAPLEAARARALAPDALDGAADDERWFTPERGSSVRTADGRIQGRAGAMVDGRCVHLAEDRRCRLHRAAGAGAKPMGCRLFPATFTDDGEAIRVSVAPECACVFVSAATDQGELLVPPGARTGADLPAEVYVTTLGDPIALASGRTAPRERYVAWSRRMAAHFRTAVERCRTAVDHADEARPSAGERSVDTVDLLWALADEVERDGLAEATCAATLEHPPAVSASELLPWLRSLRALVERRRPHDVSWRAAGDLARIG